MSNKVDNFVTIGMSGREYNRLVDAERRLVKLQEAVTPSAATKAAYMGEFSMRIPELDENGNEIFCTVNVPWITIKKIMKAIQKRAALVEEKQ